jgi:beta-N-acetylhexosaminidase
LSNREPLAAIFGCAGEVLTDEERAFFRDARPLGVILFKRNCSSERQVIDLIEDIKTIIDPSNPENAIFFIDQEGGRVARLGPPHWPSYPAPARIAALGGEPARDAAFLAARLIADDLARLGITVDCAPVLDLPAPGADPIIGNRAWGAEPEAVARLGRAFCDGLLEGGIAPVIKHIPGHGRAAVDSHRALPRVAASRDALEHGDFAPFRLLNDMPWAMTAHVVYEVIDPDRPATLSPRVIGDVIRDSIGFNGMLISDDLSMGALSGSLGARTEAALAASCDAVLHCNSNMREMIAVANAARPISGPAQARLASAEAARLASRRPFDRAAVDKRFQRLMAG